MRHQSIFTWMLEDEIAEDYTPLKLACAIIQKEIKLPGYINYTYTGSETEAGLLVLTNVNDKDDQWEMKV